MSIKLRPIYGICSGTGSNDIKCNKKVFLTMRNINYPLDNTKHYMVLCDICKCAGRYILCTQHDCVMMRKISSCSTCPSSVPEFCFVHPRKSIFYDNACYYNSGCVRHCNNKGFKRKSIRTYLRLYVTIFRITMYWWSNTCKTKYAPGKIDFCTIASQLNHIIAAK